nr:hypothetical protein [Candidatus Microthrix sp.]
MAKADGMFLIGTRTLMNRRPETITRSSRTSTRRRGRHLRRRRDHQGASGKVHVNKDEMGHATAVGVAPQQGP